MPCSNNPHPELRARDYVPDGVSSTILVSEKRIRRFRVSLDFLRPQTKHSNRKPHSRECQRGDDGQLGAQGHGPHHEHYRLQDHAERQLVAERTASVRSCPSAAVHLPEGDFAAQRRERVCETHMPTWTAKSEDSGAQPPL